MYRPKHFREDRIDVLQRTMREIGAAAVVSSGPEGLIATHVPVEIDPKPAPFGTIRFHFARPNPHASVVVDGGELLLIFQGPQGYVTPSWYPTKKLTGKVVPTWNYVAIHAYGTATSFEGPERLRPHLTALVTHFESVFPDPWSIDDAPSGYVDALCEAIIGFEIRLTRIEGKWKLSQNRPGGDRAGVVEGLRSQGGAEAELIAELIER